MRKQGSLQQVIYYLHHFVFLKHVVVLTPPHLGESGQNIKRTLKPDAADSYDQK